MLEWMREIFERPRNADKWIPALEYKYEGKGTPFTKDQFDDVIGEYSVRPLALSPFSKYSHTT